MASEKAYKHTPIIMKICPSFLFSIIRIPCITKDFLKELEKLYQKIATRLDARENLIEDFDSTNFEKDPLGNIIRHSYRFV